MQAMETTEEARRIIESIQSRYYLHPDDIAARERDPHGIETKRHKDTIEDIERMLKLYPPKWSLSHYFRISLELYKDLTHK